MLHHLCMIHTAGRAGRCSGNKFAVKLASARATDSVDDEHNRDCHNRDADGTEDAARRLNNVLWNDPATGVMRHADAGYDIALDHARAMNLRLPGILGN